MGNPVRIEQVDGADGIARFFLIGDGLPGLRNQIFIGSVDPRNPNFAMVDVAGNGHPIQVPTFDKE